MNVIQKVDMLIKNLNKYYSTFEKIESEGLEMYAGKANNQPFAGGSSINRLMMYSAMKKQKVPLAFPELPYIITPYRNDINRSSFNTIADGDTEALYMVEKKLAERHTGTYFVIYRNTKTGEISCLEHERFKETNEGYGVEMSCNIIKSEDKTVKEGEFIEKTNSFTDEGIYMDGVNLRYVTVSDEETIEDAFEMTESAARRFAAWEYPVMEVDIDITNDYVKNVYGTKSIYKPFPLPGDNIENGVIICLAKQTKRATYMSFNEKPIKDDKTIRTLGGKVIDIDVLAPANADIHNTAIREIHADQMKYTREKLEALNRVIEEYNDKDISLEMIDTQMELNAIVNQDYGFRRGNRGIPGHHVCLRFKIAHLDVPTSGQKFSGFYGSKGVVGRIIPDEKAYVDSDGNVADIAINMLCFNNRAIASPLMYSALASMIYDIRWHFKTNKEKYTYDEMFYIVAKFLDIFSIEYTSRIYKIANDVGKEKFINDFIEEQLRVVLEPYSHDVDFSNYEKAYRLLVGLEIKTGKRDAWREGFKLFYPVEFGFVEFMRLKQSAYHKSSIRTYGSKDSKGSFARSRGKKDNEDLFAGTPVKYSSLLQDVNINSIHEKPLLKMLDLDKDRTTLETLGAYLTCLGIGIKSTKED